MFPDLDRQGQIPSPLVIHCGNSQLNAEETGLKSFEEGENKYSETFEPPKPLVQSLFFFWTEQRSEGWGTYLRRWFGGGGEGNSIFASASNSHLHQERGEKEGEIKFSAHSLLPDKKSVGKLLFPTPIIPPPFSSSHLRLKDQFLIWKVGKEGGS